MKETIVQICSKIRKKYIVYSTVMILCASVVTSCGTTSVFGAASNHVHSLFVTTKGTVLLATHEGVYRSVDKGSSWTHITGDTTGQLDGLMTYSLVQNPQTQVLYILTQGIVAHPDAMPGLYQSTDDGVHWVFVHTFSGIGSGYVSFVTTPSGTVNVLYIYIADKGTSGLEESTDGGRTFQSTGTLPFAPLIGVTTIGNAPGNLLAYGPNGVARSSDNGGTWLPFPAIVGGVYEVDYAQSASLPVLYASGDAGIYRSRDNGVTFQLVESPTAYNFLTINPQNQNQLFGKTATGVSESDDGGATWHTLPVIQGNLANETYIAGSSPGLLLSLSYPVQIDMLQIRGGTQWVKLAQ